MMCNFLHHKFALLWTKSPTSERHIRWHVIANVPPQQTTHDWHVLVRQIDR